MSLRASKATAVILCVSVLLGIPGPEIYAAAGTRDSALPPQGHSLPGGASGVPHLPVSLESAGIQVILPLTAPSAADNTAATLGVPAEGVSTVPEDPLGELGVPAASEGAPESFVAVVGTPGDAVSAGVDSLATLNAGAATTARGVVAAFQPHPTIGDADGLSVGASGGFREGLRGLFRSGARSKTGPALQAIDAPRSALSQGSGRGWFGFGKSAFWLIIGFSVLQIGVEAAGIVMPLLINEKFKNPTFFATAISVQTVAGFFGASFAAPLVSKIGITRTFLSVHTAKLSLWISMTTLLTFNLMSGPLLLALYGGIGLLRGMVYTADKTLPQAIFAGLLKEDGVKDSLLMKAELQQILQRWRGWYHGAVEFFGISIPLLVGAVLVLGTTAGLMQGVLIYPVAYGAFVLLAFSTLRVSRNVDDQQGRAVDGGRKSFWAELVQGMKIVFKDPNLRTTALLYSAAMTLNPLVYSLFGTNFADRYGEAVSPDVYVIISAFISVGGMIASQLMIAQTRRLERAADPSKTADPITKQQEAAILHRSLVRWALVLIPMTVITFASMAFTLPTLGSLVALPPLLSLLGGVTLPGLLMIPFGAAQVIVYYKAMNYFQAHAEVVAGNDITGTNGALTTLNMLVDVITLVGLKQVFDLIPGQGGFQFIAQYLLPVFSAWLAYVIWRTHRLKH